MGYIPKIYNIIDQIYENSKFNILLKSFRTKNNAIERRVKQGRPLLALILNLEPRLQMLRDNNCKKYTTRIVQKK